MLMKIVKIEYYRGYDEIENIRIFSVEDYLLENIINYIQSGNCSVDIKSKIERDNANVNNISLRENLCNEYIVNECEELAIDASLQYTLQ